MADKNHINTVIHQSQSFIFIKVDIMNDFGVYNHFSRLLTIKGPSNQKKFVFRLLEVFF